MPVISKIKRIALLSIGFTLPLWGDIPGKDVIRQAARNATTAAVQQQQQPNEQTFWNRCKQALSFKRTPRAPIKAATTINIIFNNPLFDPLAPPPPIEEDMNALIQEGGG